MSLKTMTYLKRKLKEVKLSFMEEDITRKEKRDRKSKVRGRD